MLKEEEISRKFEKGFRGGSDGDLNKAFLLASIPPRLSKGSISDPNFVQILFREGVQKYQGKVCLRLLPYRSHWCDAISKYCKTTRPWALVSWDLR